MAPSTRLRSKPARRVNYAAPPTGRSGTRGNPILLEATLEPEPLPVAEDVESAPRSRRKGVVRVKSGGVTKPKAGTKKAGKAATTSKKQERPAKLECSICAATKNTLRSFKIPEDAETCDHFKSVCGQCIQRLTKTKIADRQLAEAEVGCMFPACQETLDMGTLKIAISKSCFEDYEKAVTKHSLAADPNFIACLSTKCGKYFSIEGCKGTSKRNTKQKIACPYCEYELCLSCNRPWHASTGCSKAKEKEDKDSIKEIQNMGAKQCPKCGVNIEKRGGCDHMTCDRCRHNFCWQCLVPFTAGATHMQGCPHSVRNVAQDVGNWAPENMNQAQINNLIAQAQRRLDLPIAPVPRQVPVAAQPALRAPPLGANPMLRRIGTATEAILQIFHDFNPGG